MTDPRDNPFRTLAQAAGPKPAAELVMPMSEEDRLREELERGILFTTVESVVNWARANAIWPLGFGLALALALVMLMAARPARAESIPQVPLLLEPMLKLQDLKLVRRDDRVGIGNLVVKHPKRKKAKPDEPNYESWGSAFLVGECHIMTARHVIDPDDPDNETNELPLKSRIEFVIGPIRDQSNFR